MFKNERLLTWTLIIILAITAGCKSKFEKLQQSTNTAKKYQEAIRLYNDEKYTKALLLFDDLMQRYRGMGEAEDLAYYQAYSNYKLKDFTTARYLFKSFADTYPNSPKAEECRFMTAYCFYLDSPNYTLDQDNTLRAIESLQLFLNLYPKSERAPEASRLIQDLRNKLETKSYSNAKMYLEIGDYKSAVIAFQNSMHEYPDTKYAEEMEYLTVRAQYLYAQNSLETRQEERYNETIAFANEFAEDYPTSKYLKEVQGLKKSAEQGIAQVRRILAAQQPRQQKSNENSQENKASENE